VPHRAFRDPNDHVWDVWDVQPAWAERRRVDRRKNPPDAPSPVPDRRRGAERRARLESKVHLGDGLERGWLTFESPDEKRRLAPIPSGWESLSDDELYALWLAARVVPKRFGRLIE